MLFAEYTVCGQSEMEAWKSGLLGYLMEVARCAYTKIYKNIASSNRLKSIDSYGKLKRADAVARFSA